MEEIQQIESYLRGEMTMEERREFKQRLDKEPQLQEEVDAYQKVFEGFEGMKMQAFEDRLAEWNKKLPKMEQTPLKEEARPVRRLSPWWAAAASIIGLIGLFWWMTNRPHALDTYTKQEYVALAKLGNRGEANYQSLLQVTKLFTEGQYSAALQELPELDNQDSLYLYSLQLKGHILFQSGDYQKASQTFQQIQNTYTPHSPYIPEFDVDNVGWVNILALLAYYQEEPSTADQRSQLIDAIENFIQTNPEESYLQRAQDLLLLLS